MEKFFNLDFADEINLVNLSNNFEYCVDRSKNVPYCKVYAFIRDEVCKVRENCKKRVNGLVEKLLCEVADSLKDVAEYFFIITCDELLVLIKSLDFFCGEAECFENRDDSVVIAVAAADLDEVKYAEN